MLLTLTIMTILKVAAGMKTDLMVEMYAIAAGVEGDRGVGNISHELQITTETDNLLIPVSANILYAAVASRMQTIHYHCCYCRLKAIQTCWKCICIDNATTRHVQSGPSTT